MEPGKGCGEGEGHKKKEQRTTSIIYVIGWVESKPHPESTLDVTMFCLVCFVYWSDGMGCRAFDHHSKNGGEGGAFN